MGRIRNWWNRARQRLGKGRGKKSGALPDIVKRFTVLEVEPSIEHPVDFTAPMTGRLHGLLPHIPREMRRSRVFIKNLRALCSEAFEVATRSPTLGGGSRGVTACLDAVVERSTGTIVGFGGKELQNERRFGKVEILLEKGQGQNFLAVHSIRQAADAKPVSGMVIQNLNRVANFLKQHPWLED